MREAGEFSNRAGIMLFFFHSSQHQTSSHSQTMNKPIDNRQWELIHQSLAHCFRGQRKSRGSTVRAKRRAWPRWSLCHKNWERPDSVWCESDWDQAAGYWRWIKCGFPQSRIYDAGADRKSLAFQQQYMDLNDRAVSSNISSQFSVLAFLVTTTLTTTVTSFIIYMARIQMIWTVELLYQRPSTLSTHSGVLVHKTSSKGCVRTSRLCLTDCTLQTSTRTLRIASPNLQ